VLNPPCTPCLGGAEPRGHIYPMSISGGAPPCGAVSPGTREYDAPHPEVSASRPCYSAHTGRSGPPCILSSRGRPRAGLGGWESSRDAGLRVGTSFVAKLQSLAGAVKEEERAPIAQANATNPMAIQMQVTMRPSPCFTDLSPYPTVVVVTSAHQTPSCPPCVRDAGNMGVSRPSAQWAVRSRNLRNSSSFIGMNRNNRGFGGVYHIM
jgi:hypothetical protein